MMEQRLIDANALRAKCDAPHWCVWMSEIDDAPTVDAVPVVHCGECARRYTELCALYAGQMNGKDYFIQQGDDFFCKKGRRYSDG